MIQVGQDQAPLSCTRKTSLLIGDFPDENVTTTSSLMTAPSNAEDDECRMMGKLVGGNELETNASPTTSETECKQEENEFGPLILNHEKTKPKFVANSYDFNLIQKNFFIGLRFILAIYIWASDLLTLIRDPYRYFSWHHTVTGLPTSIMVVIWKTTELCLNNERDWPYSSWLSILSLCGSVSFFGSGIIAPFEDRIHVGSKDKTTGTIICFLVGLGIICLVNVIEALIGICAMLSTGTNQAGGGNKRSPRNVLASLLQTGAFLLLILDLHFKNEFLRGLSALVFAMEGIVLSGSKMSTRRAFLYWNIFFKIIGSVAFLVAVSTFHQILRLNETYWAFPPFFTMERGLVMPFYLFVVCLWFEVDTILSSYLNQKLFSTFAILFYGALHTVLILLWAESTATNSFVRNAGRSHFEKSPTLIASCTIVSIVGFVRFVSSTIQFFRMKKGSSVSTEDGEAGLPLNHKKDNYYARSVFAPASDFFRFIVCLLTLCLSIIVYSSAVENQSGDQDVVLDIRNHRVGNQLMLLCIGIGTVYLTQTYCWIKIKLDNGHNVEEKQGKYTLAEDTYTLMMHAPPLSRPWLLGFGVFSLQAILTAMVLIAEIQQSTGNPFLMLPFDVRLSTRIGQVVGLIIILMYQSDYWTASTLLEIRFIGKGVNELSILFPAIIRFSQSIGVVVASTILILQSDSIIDLVKDYTAILFISEIDDFIFSLADRGYLGLDLKHDAEDVKEKVEVDDAPEHPIRSIGVMIIFGTMVGSWVYVSNNQIDGTFFRRAHPLCVDRAGRKRVDPLLFGDGECNLLLNYKECEFDGGDCVVQNMVTVDYLVYNYPNCNVPHRSYIGELYYTSSCFHLCGGCMFTNTIKIVFYK